MLQPDTRGESQAVCEQERERERPAPAPRPKAYATIRAALRRDLGAMLQIDAAGYREPWTEDDFKRELAMPYHMGLVAEIGPRVVGLLIYELMATGIEVHRIAVHPDYRRRGIGWALLSREIRTLRPDRRRRLGLTVRETDVAAQIWLRSCGIPATEVYRGHYEDEDGIRFCYRLPRGERP